MADTTYLEYLSDSNFDPDDWGMADNRQVTQENQYDDGIIYGWRDINPTLSN